MVAAAKEQTLQQLRHGMANRPDPELTQPWITESDAPVPRIPQRPEPPAGYAWDEVWPEEAERQQSSGEESQA